MDLTEVLAAALAPSVSSLLFGPKLFLEFEEDIAEHILDIARNSTNRRE